MAAPATCSAIGLTVAASLSQPPPSSLPRHSHGTHPLLPFLLQSKTLLQLKEIHARALRKLITSTVPTPPESFLYGRILHHAAAANHLDYAAALLCNHRHFLLDTRPSSFLWNTLIAAYSRSPDDDGKHRALDLYIEMLLDGSVPPDKYTFPFVLKTCAYLFLLPEGAQVHAHLAKLGLGPDLYVTNSVLHFYASCGDLRAARRMFDGMPCRSLVSWNVIIDGFVGGGEHDAALDLFRRLQGETEFTPDGYTLQSVLEACAGLGSLSLGMWAHAFALKRAGAWDSNFELLISNALLDMYCKGGSVKLARQLFERMPHRDAASWNSLIMGFATHGMAEDAFRAFHHMSEAPGGHPMPNSVTFLGVLSACNHGGGLVEEGRRYFSMMTDDYGIEPQIEHYGCMVDLLARAGRIDEALEVVSSMPCRPDAVIWRSLLDACSKRSVAVDVCESVARRALEESSSDDAATTSGAYVLLSRIYASADRWDNVGLVRRLMDEEGVRKEPGCSSVEIDGSVHEFLAGDTDHPETTAVYRMLDEIDEVLSFAGYVPDLSQAPMVVDEEEGDREKRRALRLHSERLAVALGLLHLRRTGAREPIRVLKNLRMCRDCHGTMKVISTAFEVEIVVRDRIRFHRFKDGLCSCSDYW